MRKLIFYIVFLFIIVSLFTCKKYSQDPSISIHTTKGRLQGDWTIKSIKVNDLDVTSQYSDSLGLSNIKDLKVKFRYVKDNPYFKDGVWYSEYYLNEQMFYSVFFQINKKAETIYYSWNVYRPQSSSLYNIFEAKCETKILRLYGHEFIIQRVNSNIKYEISYEY